MTNATAWTTPGTQYIVEVEHFAHDVLPKLDVTVLEALNARLQAIGSGWFCVLSPLDSHSGGGFSTSC